MTRIKTQWEKALGLATVPPHQRCTIISTLYLLGRLMDGEVGGSKNHVLNAYLHIYISSSSLRSRCVPWLGEGLSMPYPNYPVLCCPLPYRVAPVFVHVVSLHRLAGLPCRLFLSYGLQVVTREVHRSSLRRLICPAQDHFIFLTVLIISMTFVLSLTQMLVFLSLYVMFSILLSILVCAASSLFCACLVSVSAPYVIAGSTQELYSCLFRQMARLLLKISRCLAYAAQPAMILRCISLSWFFSLRL